MHSVYRFIMVIVALLFGSAEARAESTVTPEGVTLVYLANAGFLIESGETKILIDALFGDGIDNYPAVPAPLRRELESASGRFAGVDLVLATHHHGDHFEASAVSRHLQANPRARFVSTEQAVERLLAVDPSLATRAVSVWPREEAAQVVLPRRSESSASVRPENEDLDGVGLTVFHLHHGRGRQPPVQNLGFLLDVQGQRLLHVGDTEIRSTDPAAGLLATQTIDVALLPTWFLVAEPFLQVARTFGAETWVAMHLGAETASAGVFHPVASRQALVRHLQTSFPQIWVPTTALEPYRVPASRP